VPSISEDGHWVIVSDFDAVTGRQDSCSVSGMRKRDTDIGVFRPIHTLIEWEGYFDISQYAIEKAAELIGWASPETVASLQQRISELETSIEGARKDAFKKAQDAVKMAGVRAAQADL
jgi:hypothetical protein